MKKTTLGLLCFLTAQAASAQQGPEAVKVTDLLKIKQIGGITLTRDGRKAAFTVLGIEPDEKNKADYKNVSQLYEIGTEAGAKPRQLTAAKEGASQPAWSPDGRRPRLLLGQENTVYSNPEVSPSGKWLAFQMSPANGVNVPELAVMPLNCLILSKSVTFTASEPCWALAAWAVRKHSRPRVVFFMGMCDFSADR